MGRLKQIYNLIYKQLEDLPHFQEEIDYYRTVDYRKWTNKKFFKTMSEVTFYSNLPRETVNHKLPAIRKAFSGFSIDKVAGYTNKDIQRLKRTPGIIHNIPRIKATVKNAKEFKKIIKEYGSFLGYLDSFIGINNFNGLIKDLVERFDYIGWINVYDFLKELCLPFIKPDSNIRRIFYRLGLTKSEKETDEIIDACQEIGKLMGEAVNEQLCIVDCVLWYYGHNICMKRKPLCDECNLTRFCEYL